MKVILQSLYPSLHLLHYFMRMRKTGANLSTLYLQCTFMSIYTPCISHNRLSLNSEAERLASTVHSKPP